MQREFQIQDTAEKGIIIHAPGQVSQQIYLQTTNLRIFLLPAKAAKLGYDVSVACGSSNVDCGLSFLQGKACLSALKIFGQTCI